MSKKRLGVEALLGEGSHTTTKKKIGRPRTQTKEVTKSSQEGTISGETRATFIVNEEALEKLKRKAYWDRILIKEVLAGMIEDGIAKYERKHGEIKPLPKR